VSPRSDCSARRRAILPATGDLYPAVEFLSGRIHSLSLDLLSTSLLFGVGMVVLVSPARTLSDARSHSLPLTGLVSTESLSPHCCSFACLLACPLSLSDQSCVAYHGLVASMSFSRLIWVGFHAVFLVFKDDT
jgi:hypothetical protein